MKDRRVRYTVFGLFFACILAMPACFSEEGESTAPATELAPFVRGAHLFPVYGNRIKAMREQMELAVSKGWIASEQSSSLRSELSRLDSMEAKLTRNSSRAETDEIDRAITKFNADLQAAMRGGSSSPSSASSAPLEPAVAPAATPMSAPNAEQLDQESKNTTPALSKTAKSAGSPNALGGASAQSLLKTIKPKSK